MSLINLFKKKKDYIDRGYQSSEGITNEIPNIKVIIDRDETLYQDEIKEIKAMAYNYLVTGGVDSIEEGIIVASDNFDFIYDTSKEKDGTLIIYLKSKEKTKSL